MTEITHRQSNSSSQHPKTHFLQSLVFLFALAIGGNAFAAGSSDNEEPADDSAKQLKMIDRLIYKEKYPAAIKKLQAFLERNDTNADAWNLLGFASRKNGDMETAQNAYENALELNFEHLGALEYQGELFISMGKMEDAERNLKLLGKLCPSGCDELSELQAAFESAN